MTISRSLRNYGLALASSLVALALTVAIAPIRNRSPFLLFALAVMVSAGYGGAGAGILSVLLCTVLADYYVVPPLQTLIPTGPGDTMPVLLFMCVGIAITYVHTLLRKSRERSEENERRLLQAHDELVRANSLTTSILEGTSDAIGAVDLNFRFIAFNRAYVEGFEPLFGRPVKLGANLLDLLQLPEHREKAANEWKRAMAGEQFMVSETFGGRTYEIAFNPLRRHNGEIIGASHVVRDITARLHLEEQLRQSQKMEAIGQLAGGVAHDFNNLLTIITGYVQLALEDMTASNPLRPPLDEIGSAAERATALTRQLLAFSRRQPVNPQVISLNTIVAQLERMLRRVIGEDVHLELSLAPELPAINADPGQIEQVLMNLVVNARDAMPKGGQLNIQTSERLITGEDDISAVAHLTPGTYVQLRVTDTGNGIPAAIQLRIFDPFFTTKPPGKGTGLGLSTVYGIMARAGGAIYVESEPGNGTTFTAVFPSSQAKRSVEDTRPEPPAQGTETILVVEDDAKVRRYVHEVLAKHGYTVMEATDGEDALRVARSHTGQIHLVLTDVVMPGMGGIELARQLPSIRPGLRMLLMSGYSDRPPDEFPVLAKPFTPSTLLNRIRAVLDS